MQYTIIIIIINLIIIVAANNNVGLLKKVSFPDMNIKSVSVWVTYFLLRFRISQQNFNIIIKSQIRKYFLLLKHFYLQ